MAGRHPAASAVRRPLFRCCGASAFPDCLPAALPGASRGDIIPGSLAAPRLVAACGLPARTRRRVPQCLGPVVELIAQRVDPAVQRRHGGRFPCLDKVPAEGSGELSEPGGRIAGRSRRAEAGGCGLRSPAQQLACRTAEAASKCRGPQRDQQLDEAPETRVEFAGSPRQESASGSNRVNLPDQVEVGVTYRNVKIDYRLAAKLVGETRPRRSMS